MIHSFKLFLNQITNFKEDKFGTILLDLCYFFVFVTLLTMQIFTTREGLTFITNILSIISSVVIFAYIFFRGRFYINYIVLFTFLFVLYATVVTIFGSKSFSTLKSVFTLYSFMFMLYQFAINCKNPHFLFFSVIVGIFLLTVVFYLRYSSVIISTIKSGESFERLGEEYGNLNYIGRVFAAGAIFLVFFAFNKKKLHFLWLIPAIIIGGSCLLTGSRGAFLVFILGSLVPIYFVFPKGKKWIYFAIVLLGVLLIILMLQLPGLENFKKGLENSFLVIFERKNVESSSFRRLTMFEDGILIWFKNMFFGYGAYGFASVSSYTKYSHNSISEMLCDFGLIGTTLYIIPLVSIFTTVFSKKNHQYFYKVFAIAFFISFICLGILFEVIYTDKNVVLFLTTIAASAFLFDTNENKRIEFSFIKDGRFKFNCGITVNDCSEAKEQ